MSQRFCKHLGHFHFTTLFFSFFTENKQPSKIYYYEKHNIRYFKPMLFTTIL